MANKQTLIILGGSLLIVLAILLLWEGDAARPPGERPRVVDYRAHQAPPSAQQAPKDILGRRIAAVRTGAPVPRRFFSGFPADLMDIPAGPERKRRFLAVMLPLVLRANEIMNDQRAHMKALFAAMEAGETLAEEDRIWLLATYNRLTRSEAQAVDTVDRAALERRLAPVPVSLALTQAAMESAWGTSRFAREGNAAFGVWTWNETHEGIVPERRAEGANHRVRAYAYLIDSVMDYITTLNKGGAYKAFRAMRAKQLDSQKPLDGLALAQTMVNYSERREAYVTELRQIIQGNRMTDFDRARLVQPDTPAS